MTGTEAGEPRPRARGLPVALVLACLLYVGFRALVLYTSFDAVAMPSYELSPMGVIAKMATVEAETAPIHKYYDNAGGHLVVGVLAAPLFALFGDTYLTLKLVPLLLGLGTLLLAWYVLDRYFDRRAANLTAFLFALGPPTLTKYSLLAKGNHFENVFFQLLLVLLFFRAHESGLRRGWLFAASAAAGFAIFFYKGSLLLVSILAALHLAIRGPRRSARDLAGVLPGLALGLAPLAWVHLRTQGKPLTWLGWHLLPERATESGYFLERARWFLTEILPRAGAFEDLGPLPGRVAESVFLIVFVLAWLTVGAPWLRGVARAVSSHRRPGQASEEDLERERFRALRAGAFVLYLPLLVVVLGLTNYRFKRYGPPVEVGQFRYLVPHFALATMLIGAAVGALLRRAGWRRGVGLGIGALALTTTLFTLPIVRWSTDSAGLGSRYDGYVARNYAAFLVAYDPERPSADAALWDHDALRAHAAGFEPELREEILFGLGHHVAWNQVWPGPGGAADQLSLALFVEHYEPAEQVALARGAGSCLRRLHDESETARARLDRILIALAALAAAGDPLAPYVAEGLCLDFRFPLSRSARAHLRTSAAIGRELPAQLARGWRRGHGIQCGRLLARGIAADVQLVSDVATKIAPRQLPDFWFGVGWSLAELTPGVVPDLDAVPPERRSAALEGIGAALRHRLGPERAGRESARLAAELSDSERAALARGVDWPDYPRPPSH